MNVRSSYDIFKLDFKFNGILLATGSNMAGPGKNSAKIKESLSKP